MKKIKYFLAYMLGVFIACLFSYTSAATFVPLPEGYTTKTNFSTGYYDMQNNSLLLKHAGTQDCYLGDCYNQNYPNPLTVPYISNLGISDHKVTLVMGSPLSEVGGYIQGTTCFNYLPLQVSTGSHNLSYRKMLAGSSDPREVRLSVDSSQHLKLDFYMINSSLVSQVNTINTTFDVVETVPIQVCYSMINTGYNSTTTLYANGVEIGQDVSTTHKYNISQVWYTQDRGNNNVYELYDIAIYPIAIEPYTFDEDGVCGYDWQTDIFDENDACYLGILTGTVFDDTDFAIWTFDGVDDYLYSSDDLSLGLTQFTNTVVSLRFQLGKDGIDNANSQPLFSLPYFYSYVREGFGQTNGVRFRYDNSGAKESVYFLPNGDRDRHHLTAVFGATGSNRYTQIWVDGILRDTDVHTVPPSQARTTSGLVELAKQGSSYFSGNIQDFRIYSLLGSSIDSTDVYSLSQSDYSSVSSNLQPFLFWDTLNQNGIFVTDQSLNSRNGHIIGASYDKFYGTYSYECYGSITSETCQTSISNPPATSCGTSLDDLCPGVGDRDWLYEYNDVDQLHYWACGPISDGLEGITSWCTLELDTGLAECGTYNKQYYGSGYFPDVPLTGNQLCMNGNEFSTEVEYSVLNKNWVWFCEDPLGSGQNLRCDAKSEQYIEPFCGPYQGQTFSGHGEFGDSISYLMTGSYEQLFCESGTMSLVSQLRDDVYDYEPSDAFPAGHRTQQHVGRYRTCTIDENGVSNQKFCGANKEGIEPFFSSDVSIDDMDVLFLTQSFNKSKADRRFNSWVDTLLRWLGIGTTIDLLFTRSDTSGFNVFIPIFSKEGDHHYLDFEAANIQVTNFEGPFELECSGGTCNRTFGNFTIRGQTPTSTYYMIAFLSAMSYLVLYYGLLFFIVLGPFLVIFNLFKMPVLFLFLGIKEPLNSRLGRLSTLISMLIGAGLLVSGVVFVMGLFSNFFFNYGTFLYTLFAGIVSMFTGSLVIFQGTIVFLSGLFIVVFGVYLVRYVLSSSPV